MHDKVGENSPPAHSLRDTVPEEGFHATPPIPFFKCQVFLSQMFTWEVSKEFRFPASYLTLTWHAKSLEIATHPYKGIALSQRKTQQLLDFSEKTSDREKHSQSSRGGRRIWTVTLMQQDLQEQRACMEILINWGGAGGSAQSKLRKACGGSKPH